MIDTRSTSSAPADRILRLPAVIAGLVTACHEVRKHYGVVHGDRLLFTLDGNLVGDIGEALAVEYFGVTLNERCGEGIDGKAGRTVRPGQDHRQWPRTGIPRHRTCGPPIVLQRRFCRVHRVGCLQWP